MVRARRLARSSSALQAQWRPLLVDDIEQTRMGCVCVSRPIGRKSGQERSVIVGYIEDGPNLVLVAMNGWEEGHPSWWLNLEAHPDAVVRLPGEDPRRVHALRVEETERDRLWQRWAAVQPELDGYAPINRDACDRPQPRDGTA